MIHMPQTKLYIIAAKTLFHQFRYTKHMQLTFPFTSNYSDVLHFQLSSFRSSVHQLLSNHDVTLADGSSITDFDLMTSLEKLLASHEKHRTTAKCLEASLRQLEQGFKNNYKDTLTLLNSD